MTDLLVTPSMMSNLLDGLIKKTLDGNLRWKVPGLYDDKPAVLASFAEPRKGKKGPPARYTDVDELCAGNIPAGSHTHYIKFSGRTLSVTRPVAGDRPNTVLVFRTKLGGDDGLRSVLINLSFAPDGSDGFEYDGKATDNKLRAGQIREYNLKVQVLCAAIDSYRNGVQVLEDQMAEDANIKAGEAAIAALDDLLK